MKYAFLLGLLLGVAGVVAAAAWLPAVDHPRLRSETTVLPNGGRAEVFRLRTTADAVAETRGAEASGQGLGLYKIRNVHDEVIGIASRLGTDAASADWCLVLPARGALFLRRDRNAAGRILHGTAEFAGAEGRFEESAAGVDITDLRVTLTRTT